MSRVWWRDGVIYQIYPRSFADANGDGVGDLEGIRSRLDHLAWLGIDGIWLSPCFPSPMADFGYDVADYCDIEPVFGKLADFDRLLVDAHARGIRVILDWVPNHTSEQHPWFLESRSSRTSPKRGWYVWRDAKPDGALPNNWPSMFGGPAWERDPKTDQYYLHSFLREQPDLEWRNPEVVRAMHDVLRFWLTRGVDGFRIDVIHRIAKDPKLRDNPEIAGQRGWGGQHHVHDENHPDIHELLRGIRRVLDAFPERMAVGEIGLEPEQVATYAGKGDELHLGFNFAFLRSAWTAASFRHEVERFERALGTDAWPNLVLSNHDVPRHATRYDDPAAGEARARVAAVLMLALRGTPFLYYGEEIGMRNVEIPVERMQDPLARTLHPKLSRDGERTPMQWRAGPGAGFTTGTPWLPLAPDADARNVEAQRAERGSLLWLYRDLLALRRRTPALERGDYRTLDAPADVLAWERRTPQSVARVAANFGGEPRKVDLGAGAIAEQLSTVVGARHPERSVVLAPNEAVVRVLAPSA